MNFARLPWVTISLVASALVAHVLPGLSAAWQFDRIAFNSGDWWRLFTGHLTHWNTDHLLWDLVVFVAFGAWAERSSRRAQFTLMLVVSMLAISAGTWCLQPELSTYRGLSGVDSALFALLAGRTWIEKWKAADWAMVMGVSLLLGGFAAKMIYEAAFGSTLFVDSLDGGFTSTPLAHVLGAGVGTTYVLKESFESRRGRNRSAFETSCLVGTLNKRAPLTLD